jgi:hypothetical protein
MGHAGEGPVLLDRISLSGTRLVGALLIATGLWSAITEPDEHLIWGSLMSLSGVGLCALFLPILRAAAFAFLFFAGLTILGGLSPFAAIDMSHGVRERPGAELRQIAAVLGLSLLFVLSAFLIDRARSVRLATLSTRVEARESPRAPDKTELSSAAKAPAPPSPTADDS